MKYVEKYLNKWTDEIVDYDGAVEWICETYHITLNEVYTKEEVEKQAEFLEVLIDLDFEHLDEDDLEEIKLIENNKKLLEKI